MLFKSFKIIALFKILLIIVAFFKHIIFYQIYKNFTIETFQSELYYCNKQIAIFY